MAQCGLMRASSTLATKVGAVGVPLTIIFFRDFHGQPQPPKKKKYWARLHNIIIASAVTATQS